jgi:hypothetical protein
VGIVEAQVTTPPELPDHDTEMTAAHEGRPTVAEQALTHGAGIPQPDHGMTDSEKYGSAQ